MVVMELNVSGMSCGHCKASVEKALKELGVNDVSVELATGVVKVSYEDSHITREMIINTIDDAGYTVL
ncbi:heavy-metal-associated domain-containing protein [Alkalicella caledoniensis]|uniref:Copper chaperone CopZ n=1 Tax=Alkalicella caledoniensis TaxID=2731377 RepID=A0A7G9WC80_ALKCA|nr:cation transporter [Alkalicella caledoniensis]QNO16292.1 heavy-metal-associated domain-containing protein [Alkalicella caledoniensis]